MPGLAVEHAPQIAFASANLLPSLATLRSANLESTLAALRSAAFLGEFVQEAGYDGAELHPIFHSAQHYGAAVRAGELAIVSLHQSFRTGSDERTTFEEKGGLQARLINGPAGRILLPNMAQSAVWMDGVQRASGARYPGVFYPQQRAEADVRNLSAAHTRSHLFQPTDQVAQLVGANSVAGMLEQLAGRGYDGICFDTYHAQRRYGSETPGPVSNLAESLEELAPGSRAVHLSLNRNDISGEPHIETKRDLEVLLQRGEFVGQTADIMAAMRERGSAIIRHVTIELTLGGLHEVTGHTKLKDHQKAYADIAHAVRSYFALAA